MRRSPVRVDGALVGLHEALVRRVVRAADAARAALDVGVALFPALLLDVDARARHLVDRGVRAVEEHAQRQRGAYRRRRAAVGKVAARLVVDRPRDLWAEAVERGREEAPLRATRADSIKFR